MDEILLYKTPNDDIRLEVFIQDETIWLTQKQMANIFRTTKQNIGQHLKNIFAEGELIEKAVVKDFFTTAKNWGKIDEKLCA